MTVIARCKACGTEVIIREGETITNACACPLRADWPGWEFVEMVPAEQLRGAVDVLGAIGYPSEFLQSRSALSGKAREWLQANGHTPTGGQSGALPLPSSHVPKEGEDAH